MTHDPMCPQYDCWLEGCTVCDECALIARVREDERRRAAEIVKQTQGIWKDPEMAWSLIEAIRGSDNNA